MQSVHLPLARLRFNIALPPVVLILLRKPWVRARDLRDLFLFVRQRAAFPALTTRPRRLVVLVPLQVLKSNPKDKPIICLCTISDHVLSTHLCQVVYIIVLSTKHSSWWYCKGTINFYQQSARFSKTNSKYNIECIFCSKNVVSYTLSVTN